ncbi:minor tail protein [Microbacterium phage FuzzBuster]|uniref:Minor tail protein n=1 Tax=Microbacterium phage FuzzBuster TaxID=2590935 RepID=A0A516KV19_9CAUD|nr:minor tail protein [Microbacterium phage FuzzBuster]
MAYDISISAPYSGRPAFNVYLYVRRDQTDVANNRSSYAFAIYARNPNGSTQTYALDCYGWGVNVGGQMFSGCHNLDFRSGTTMLTLGSGTTGWFGHDGNGYLTIVVDCYHGPASIFGTADPGWVYFDTDRIPKPPGAPFSVSVDQATTTSLRYIFSGTTDGGSPILEWQAQASTTSNFSANVITLGSTGNTTFTGLTPGNTYYFRARGRNAVGWGNWSVVDGNSSGTTLPATPPGMTVTPAIAGTSATVTLTPPPGVSSVTSYRVERRPVGGGTATVYNSPTSPIVVSPLTPGTVWEWRASAFIGTYQSPWTDWATVQQPNPNTSPGDYFDGNTPARGDLTFAWLSTANNSASEARGVAPDGWATTSGAGALPRIQRITGGRYGTYSARALVIADASGANGLYLGMNFSNALHRAAIAEGGVYVGSMYVRPSRAQRLQLELVWANGAGAEVAPRGSGEVVVVTDTSGWTRLSVTATAPLGAVSAVVRVRDVAGTGFSPWLSGETLDADAVMLSIGEMYDYFDGNTPDTAQWEYAWLGTANASASMATALDPADFDPLADPDCPPIPSAPTPPVITDDCLDEVGSWRRYWAIIPQDEISDWLALVPTIRISTGGLPARQVRIRTYPNPDGLDPSVFPANEWEFEQIVSFIPANTAMTIDGVAQRVWAEVNGAAPISADRLLYGTGGGPASWPVLSCGTAYLVSFDVPLDAPEGNLSVEVALTTRML